MSFLMPFGDHKSSSSNTTQQTDARTVTDYSGASLGQTINIYGATADTMSQFLKGNQQASPFTSSAEAVGMAQGGEGLGGFSLSPVTLAIGAAVLLAVVALKR